MKIMYEHVNKRNGKWSPLLSDDVYEIIKEVRAEPSRRSRTSSATTARGSYHPRLDDQNPRAEWREP